MRIKTIIAVVMSAAIFVSCTDTGYIDRELESLKEAVAQLQEQCNTLNNAIETLDEVLAALRSRDFVTGVYELKGSDGQVSGYTITFVNYPTITIWLPKGTQNPGTVHVPVISVKIAGDGQYYWTCDGEFITDDSGNKVPTGTDGLIPKLKVEDGKWYVSYDGEKTWQYLTDAPDGQVSGYVFTKVDTSDPTKVVLTLADGQTITLPTNYESLITLSISDSGISYNPGDVITLTYTALMNVTVIVDDSDVETSEVVEADSKNGTIKIQTRSGVSLNKQRAFIIFTIEGSQDSDWRMLSFDSSMRAYISDIK